MNAQELRAAFQTRRPKVRPVEVEGVGTVFMRDLTVGEINSEIDNRRARYIQMAREQGIAFDPDDEEATTAAINQVKDPHRLARIIARRMCDEDGTRIFDENNPVDLAVIEGLEETVFNRLDKATQEDAPKN